MCNLGLKTTPSYKKIRDNWKWVREILGMRSVLFRVEGEHIMKRCNSFQIYVGFTPLVCMYDIVYPRFISPFWSVEEERGCSNRIRP